MYQKDRDRLKFCRYWCPKDGNRYPVIGCKLTEAEAFQRLRDACEGDMLDVYANYITGRMHEVRGLYDEVLEAFPWNGTVPAYKWVARAKLASSQTEGIGINPRDFYFEYVRQGAWHEEYNACYYRR